MMYPNPSPTLTIYLPIVDSITAILYLTCYLIVLLVMYFVSIDKTNTTQGDRVVRQSGQVCCNAITLITYSHRES